MKAPSATLVGGFVLGALGLIAVAILFFGGGGLFKPHIDAVAYFHGSVAGLQPGAAVTYRGVHVGEVKSIGIRVDPDPTRSIAQVNLVLRPEAVNLYEPGGVRRDDAIAPLVEQGLSARLVMQSLVTGLLQVELDFRPGIPASRLGEPSDVPEIPTVPSAFQTLTEQVENVDIAGTVTTLQHTLGSLDALLRDPALHRTIESLPAVVGDLRATTATTRRAIDNGSASLQKTLASVQGLADDVDREAKLTLPAVRATIEKANTAIDGANVLLDPNGGTIARVQQAVDDFGTSAERLRDFSERVDRDPTILVRGRGR